MKSVSLAALLLLSSTSCIDIGGNYRLVTDGYRFDYEGAAATKNGSGDVKPGIARVEVDHKFGEVKIEAVGPGEPTGWSWSAEVWADDDVLAEMILDELAMRASRDGETMFFDLELPESFKDEVRGLRSTLTVLVDDSVEVDTRNSFGDTRVEGVAGDVSFHAAHGDSHFVELSGKLAGRQAHGELFADGIQGAKLEASHGRVTVRNAGPLEIQASHGDGSYDGIREGFVLRQRHGDVEIHDGPHIHGDSAHARWRIMDVTGLDLDASHGDITARLLSGSARVETQHGDVTIERAGVASSSVASDYIRSQHGDVTLDLRAQGYADIKASHGDVTIFHTLGSGAAIDASASHGDIKSDLPVVRSMAAGRAGAKVRTAHGDIRCVTSGAQ